MKNTGHEFTRFREEFKKAVAKLEKEFKVELSLGNITYDATEFRVKLTAKNSEYKRSTPSVVYQITHHSINPNNRYELVKMNRKNWKMMCIEGDSEGRMLNCPPEFIVEVKK